jgi:hypothetical protein
LSTFHLGPKGGHADCDTAHGGSPSSSTLTAARLKATTKLDGSELLTAPEGKPRITLRIRLPDRTVSADIAAKSLRKAQTAIREAGADNIALVLQGRLIAGDRVAEAGLSAQPKAAKPLARSEALEINHGSAAMYVEERSSTHEPTTYDYLEIDMAKPPFERSNHPQHLPEAPSPSATSAPEGLERARALARSYLPELVRLHAGIALSPDSEAALHTRMLAAKEIR